MRFYSIVVPVYNRPGEVKELLESLAKQTYKNFEVLIVEDGSTLACKDICALFTEQLKLRYFYKENAGQGFARNFAFERAEGDYFIQLDSDALAPPQYLQAVENALNTNYLDAFGGPDAADDSFTPIQKAVNYAMTSLFTTGGIRGKKNNLGGQFHPRSFNFGLSKQVYEKVGGYKITRLGEDIEFSIRIISNGFKVGLIEEAFIYHKRRTSFSQFYKQLHFFGRARINISRFFPKELKLVHFFPAAFTSFVLSIPVLFLFYYKIGLLAVALLFLYFCLIFIDSSRKNKSYSIGFMSIVACFIQLFAYGIGFFEEAFKRN
jgi:glycosyltransferase involved in cell wall biosynthesis